MEKGKMASFWAGMEAWEDVSVDVPSLEAPVMLAIKKQRKINST